MKLAEPPGSRSCGEGGEWDVCLDENGESWFSKELKALWGRLGDHAAAMVKAELREKMKRATLGTLVYGEGPEGDVEKMYATRDVLELRLSATAGDDGDTLHIRLFFSEPEELPGRMCALMVFWKRPGEIDLDDQSAAARAASRRLAEWNHAGRPC